MQSQGSKLIQIEITPTVTAAAYSAGNQVGGIQALTTACLDEGRFAQLVTLSVIDKAKQKAALTIFFFDQSPTIASTDKTAFDLTDANMALNGIGQVTIAAADYQDSASNSIATKSFTAFFKSKATGTPGGHLYAVAMTTGTPTYVSTSDLVFKYILAQGF